MTRVTSVVENERVAGSAFGALLRRHRLAAGLSQEDLAEQARMSARGIGALERGDRRYPYRETVVLLAKALSLAPAAAAEFEAAALRPREPRARVDLEAAAADDPSRATNLPLSPVVDPKPKTNLPPSRSRLVGREAEIADIAGALEQSRLVTVTGAGGVGKTRTALAVGATLVAETKGGVWLVELAPLARGELVPSAVARVLELQESPGRQLIETLVSHLKQKSLLLILDNCEHVLSETAALADALLSGCPLLKILATSREALRITGEQTYRLPSLRVPKLRDTSGLSATRAGEYAALMLFAQRAYAIDRGFALADNNAPIVAQICRRLDGIPLAIELAAARVNVLTLGALLTELDQRFRILTSGNRTALPRHQTMRALIDWSYDLLREKERVVFRRLAIFAGGWTPEAAQAVCAGGGVEARGVLEMLWSLIDKSLVIADLSGERARYRLLESTRDYALEKLVESGEHSSISQRHANWVADFVERCAEEYWELPQARWLAPLEIEVDNFRAALRWALEERGDAVVGGRIAGAVPQLWYSVCLVHEAHRWLELALAAVDEAMHRRIVGRLWLAEATLTSAEPRVRAAQRAIRCIEPLEDSLLLAEAHLRLAQGQGHCAAPSLDASDRALTLSRSLVPVHIGLLAAAVMFRGATLFILKMYSEARIAFEEALALFREMGDERRTILVELNLSELEFAAGDTPVALALALSAASRAEMAGMVAIEAVARSTAATFHVFLRQIDEAEGDARGALTLARSSQDDLYRIHAIWILATVAALDADIDRAARLRGYVDAWVDSRGFRRSGSDERIYDILVTELRAHLSDERIAQLAEAGARLSDDDAAAHAAGDRTAGIYRCHEGRSRPIGAPCRLCRREHCAHR